MAQAVRACMKLVRELGFGAISFRFHCQLLADACVLLYSKPGLEKFFTAQLSLFHRGGWLCVVALHILAFNIVFIPLLVSGPICRLRLLPLHISELSAPVP